MAEITVATSIIPRNIELQRAAIDSWLNLGFKVISLNSREEITLLSSEFPKITFEPAARTALKLAGKPYVFFDDILNVLSRSGSNICGIINSDIHLRVSNCFVKQLSSAASTGFLFASRVDIASLTDHEGKVYPYGFDCFFFSKKLIPDYPSSDFCLGAPWWDYWAVLVPIAKGYDVKEIITMGVSHLIHESRWHSNLHNFFCNHLLDVAQSSELLNDDNDELIKTLLSAYETENFFLVSLLYLNYIQNNASLLHFDDIGEFGSFMSNQYISTRNELVEAKINSYYLTRELERLRLYTDSLKNGANGDPLNRANSLYRKAVAVFERVLNLSKNH